MKTYKNVTGINRFDLDHSSLLDAIKEQLENSYPNLGGESLTIVADLMLRFDEDITENNGKFSCYQLIFSLINMDTLKTTRIQTLKDTVQGMSPKDFSEFYQLKTVETASHWSDLHTGRSSFALVITSDEELEAIEIAASVNNWGGEYGELKNRGGHHHSTFSSVFDLGYYRKSVENYFYEHFVAKSQEIEEEYFLERIKEADSIATITEIVNDFYKLEDGFYTNDNSLVIAGLDFDNFWGYYYDVYSYSFGYNLPSRKVFYDGIVIDNELPVDNDPCQ